MPHRPYTTGPQRRHPRHSHELTTPVPHHQRFGCTHQTPCAAPGTPPWASDAPLRTPPRTPMRRLWRASRLLLLGTRLGDLEMRGRLHARGRRAARCACRRQSSPCGACGACAARASRPAVSTVHGTRTTDPSTGVACAAAALPRSALAALAVRCQGGRHPSALCEGASRLTRCRGLAWGPMGWHARCGAHLDARRVDEAADEDAVELEAAQPPAAPGTSEKRPAGANAPTGG
jgi:hypothetical protein